MDTHAAPPALVRSGGPCADCRLGLAPYWPYIMAAIHFRQKEVEDRMGQAAGAAPPPPLDLGRFLAEVAEVEAQGFAVPPQGAVG